MRLNTFSSTEQACSGYFKDNLDVAIVSVHIWELEKELLLQRAVLLLLHNNFFYILLKP